MNCKNDMNKMQEEQDVFFERHNIVVGDDNIKVPEEFEGRLERRLGMLKPRVRSMRVLVYAAAAAFMLVSCTMLVYVSPGARTFAEKLPLVGNLISNLYRDDSIETAKKSGYIKVTDLVKEQDGLRLEVGELYFDGLRLSMDAKLSGIYMNQILSEEEKYKLSLKADIAYPGSSDANWGFVSKTFKVREKNERYTYSRIEKVFIEEELNNILDKNKEIEIILDYEVYERPGIGAHMEGKTLKNGRFIIPVALSGFSGIKKEEKGIEYCFDNDFPVKSVGIKSILSSPTLSQLVYSMDMKENYNFLGLHNAYIEDEQGTRFKGESGQMRFFSNRNFIKEGKDEFIEISGHNSASFIETDGRFKLDITPSFYDSSVKLKKLCFEGIDIMERKEFTLDLKGSFPQYITFGQNRIVVKSAEYKDGGLRLMINKYEPDFQEFGIQSIESIPNRQTGEHMISGYNPQTGEYTVSPYGTDDLHQVSLEKKDKYDLMVNAKYTIRKKVEIPLYR